MFWPEVCHNLRDRLGKLDTARLECWLDRLGETDAGKHLGTCILIDIDAPIVEASVFINILRDLDVKAADPVHEFGRAVDRIESVDDGPTWQDRLSGGKECAPRECARVLEIGQFIRFCLAEETDLMDDSYLKVARIRYFSGTSGRPLGGVTHVFSGNRRRVWVVPTEDLIQLQIEYGEKSGSVIRDALGLPFQDGVGEGGRPELVAVLYPKPPEMPSTQPSTLDATWTSSPCYFVPTKSSSGWGRTHSCSGTGPTCRERVHSELPDGLSDEFRGIYLGIASTVDGDNWRAVLDEAYRRWQAVREQDLKAEG